MAEPIRKLAIVGASVRAAAFSALRAGYEVVAADLFADADLARECPATRITGYPDSLADWLAAAECDAWLYTGAIENHPELIDRMAMIRPLLGNGGEALRKARDPLLLQDLLRDAGLSFPETVADPADLPHDGSWLCKTYRSASGIGVWSLDGSSALHRAAEAGAVYQRLVDDDHWDAAAIFVLSGEQSFLLGVTQQFVGEADGTRHPWQYSGSMGPLSIGPVVEKALMRLQEVLAHRIGLRGMVGVDLVMQQDLVWIIEVNPRYTASVEIVERMTGASAIASHIAAFKSGREDVSNAPSTIASKSAADGRAFGKVILFAEQDVTISARFHRWAMSKASIDQANAVLADVPHAGENIKAGQPVLTVFTDGKHSVWRSQLEGRLVEVKARLYAR